MPGLGLCGAQCNRASLRNCPPAQGEERFGENPSAAVIIAVGSPQPCAQLPGRRPRVDQGEEKLVHSMRQRNHPSEEVPWVGGLSLDRHTVPWGSC